MLFSRFRKLFIAHITSGNFPPPLDAETERELLLRMANGDIDARNTLIEHNLRLVAHVVKKYSTSVDADDLISIGTIGLIKGITSFDMNKNIRLATYVSRCIDNEVLMSLRHDKKFSLQVSLHEPIGFDGEGNEVSLMDVLESEGADICDEIDKNITASILGEKVKNVLETRERRVIALRYGLVGGESLTQREVARVMGISRSYVSRIEKRALEKLRQNCAGM